VVSLLIYMERSDQNHKNVLNYGKTDGTNIPFMPSDKYFSVGYNNIYGLIDVCEGNGDPVFEGRVGIEKLLLDLRSEPKERVDPKVEDLIMKSYNNYRDHQKNPKKHDSPRTPIMEVLTDNC